MDRETKVSFDHTQIAYAAKSNIQLKKMQFVFGLLNFPEAAKVGTFFLKKALQLHLPVNFLIKNTLFEVFCAGETLEKSLETTESLAAYNVKSILDYSVEGEKSEKGFDDAMTETIRTIEFSNEKPELPFCVFKMTGLANFQLLEKVHSGDALTPAELAAWEKVKARVIAIGDAAKKAKVKLLIDAEETWIQNAVDKINLLMIQRYNQDAANVYVTYQLYTKEGLDRLKSEHQYLKSQGLFLGVKLVRGAYMEKERARAEDLNYPDPIQVDRSATDVDYNIGMQYCIDNLDSLGFFCGSHNEASNYQLIDLMAAKGLENDDERVYFSQLYGMSDNISFNLANAGYNVAKYVPYGPIKYVTPYLLRRADENTSIADQGSREYKMLMKEVKRRGM